jgi:hypothetical protein
VVKN